MCEVSVNMFNSSSVGSVHLNTCTTLVRPPHGTYQDLLTRTNYRDPDKSTKISFFSRKILMLCSYLP